MNEDNLASLLMAGLGIVGIELINDVAVQEWTKIFLQAAIAGATIYKVFKKEKERD